MKKNKKDKKKLDKIQADKMTGGVIEGAAEPGGRLGALRNLAENYASNARAIGDQSEIQQETGFLPTDINETNPTQQPVKLPPFESELNVANEGQTKSLHDAVLSDERQPWRDSAAANLKITDDLTDETVKQLAEALPSVANVTIKSRTTKFGRDLLRDDNKKTIKDTIHELKADGEHRWQLTGQYGYEQLKALYDGIEEAIGKEEAQRVLTISIDGESNRLNFNQFKQVLDHKVNNLSLEGKQLRALHENNEGNIIRSFSENAARDLEQASSEDVAQDTANMISKQGIRGWFTNSDALTTAMTADQQLLKLSDDFTQKLQELNNSVDDLQNRQSKLADKKLQKKKDLYQKGVDALQARKQELIDDFQQKSANLQKERNEQLQQYKENLSWYNFLAKRNLKQAEENGFVGQRAVNKAIGTNAVTAPKQVGEPQPGHDSVEDAVGLISQASTFFPGLDITTELNAAMEAMPPVIFLGKDEFAKQHGIEESSNLIHEGLYLPNEHRVYMNTSSEVVDQHTLVHELLHGLSQYSFDPPSKPQYGLSTYNSIGHLLGTFVNEGMTEFYKQELVRNSGEMPNTSAYPDEVAFARALRDHLGKDSNGAYLMDKAYFLGDWGDFKNKLKEVYNQPVSQSFTADNAMIRLKNLSKPKNNDTPVDTTKLYNNFGMTWPA